MQTIIRISYLIRDQIFLYLEEQLPEEACGFLAGTNGNVEVFFPIRNELHSSMKFRMAPDEQINAMLLIERQGMEIIGIFHSHPLGPETPSITDIKEYAYPESASIICSKENGSWMIRGFMIRDGRITEIGLAYY